MPRCGGGALLLCKDGDVPHTHADGDASHTTHITDGLSVITLKVIPRVCLPQVQQGKIKCSVIHQTYPAFHRAGTRSKNIVEISLLFMQLSR